MKKQKIYQQFVAVVLSLTMIFSLQGIMNFSLISVKASNEVVPISVSVANGDYTDYSVSDTAITLKSTDKTYQFEEGTYSGRSIEIEGDNVGISLNNTVITDNDSSNTNKSIIQVPRNKSVTITTTGDKNKLVAAGTTVKTIYSDGNVTVGGTGSIEFNGQQFYTSVSTTFYEGDVTINAIGKEGARQEALYIMSTFDIKDSVVLNAQSSYSTGGGYANAINISGYKTKQTVFTAGDSSKISLTAGEKDSNTYEDGYGISSNIYTKLVFKDSVSINSYVEDSSNITGGQIIFQDNSKVDLTAANGKTGSAAIAIQYLDSCIITGNSDINILTAGAGLYDNGTAKTPLEISQNAKVNITGNGVYPSVLLNNAGLKMSENGYLYTSSDNVNAIQTLSLDMSGSSKLIPVSASGKLEAFVVTNVSVSDSASILPEGTQKKLLVDGDLTVTGGTLNLSILAVAGSVSITGGNSTILGDITSFNGKDVILTIKKTGENSNQVSIPSSAKVGELVNIVVNSGYEIESILVNGSKIEGTSFTMPSKLTTVEVSAKKKESATKPTPTTKVAIRKVTVSKIKATTYTGYKKKPSVTVKYNGKKLKKNSDYTVSYKNNVKVGTAKVIIKGKGNYTGTKTVTFKIKKRTSYAKGIYVVKTTVLIGRAGPSSKKSVRAYYKKGTKLEVLKVYKKTKKHIWLKVKKNKKITYVYAKYLKL